VATSAGVTTPNGADVTQVRLQLRRTAVVRLMEWQTRAVGAGLPKPSYSELLDAVLGAVDLDPTQLVRLLARDE
jgi:hypothetical protein